MNDSDNTQKPSDTPQEEHDPRKAIASRGLREGAVPRDDKKIKKIPYLLGV